jgi:hypothetical protein
MFVRDPRLLYGSVFDSVRIPPTDAEIEKLQNPRLQHIKNFDQYCQESNAKALACLRAEADRRDDEMVKKVSPLGARGERSRQLR